MSAGQYERVDRIFSAALQLPAEQRAAFVAREAGSDDILRSEVVSLLAAADESGSFMERPAIDRLSALIAAEGWTLAPGVRIGAYTILRLMGSGGAGEVWRARDERLGRDVAIKVLLPYFATHQDGLRRFADEARTASALNHANIVAIYDVGDVRGFPYLVSECLEGESLRTRLARGSLPLETAVSVALQVARGLAAAHVRGVIHRDLKPENLFLRSDGVVKILDFGLAKLQMTGTGAVQTATQTMAGVIVGTAGYMAPEQVRGEEADARSDLFVLGIVLFEMLAGRQAFTGRNTFETLNAILTLEPPDLSAIAPRLPSAVADIVGRLLDKSPEARFQSAADLAWALERVPSGRTAAADSRRESPPARSDRRWRWIGAAAAATVLAFILGFLSNPAKGTTDSIRMTRVTWSLPPGVGLASAPVVSPDSRRLAFTGQTDTGTRLWVRDLASLDATTIAGTEGAKQPFWSPDGKSLGYFADGKLMKVVVDGGAPVVLANARDARGGAWSPSGVIVFQSDFRDTGLSQVPADGGAVTPATLLDVSGPDVSHRWPAFLPDGVHFLHHVLSIDDERPGVYLASLADSPAHPTAPLIRESSGAVYAAVDDSAIGWLLSSAGRWIEARRFDPERLEVIGGVRRIDVAAPAATGHHAALFSASSGTLAFGLTGIPVGSHVAVATRTGAALDISPERALDSFYRLSPDGNRLARTRVDETRGNPDIWVDDLVRGNRTRLTTARDIDVLPVWSPDGRRIAYRSGIEAKPGLSIVNADGLGSIVQLPCPRPYCEPTDWTSDDLLIVNVTGGDVWAVPIRPGEPPHPLLSESFAERDARVSRDGRWIAYVSHESGRPVVSVRGLAPKSPRSIVSEDGGDQPVWRRDGAELFYVNAQQLLRAVPVRPAKDGGLEFGLPRPLNVPAFAERHWGTAYDVSPDGARVYFPHPGEERPPREVGLLLEWRALLPD